MKRNFIKAIVPFALVAAMAIPVMAETTADNAVSTVISANEATQSDVFVSKTGTIEKVIENEGKVSIQVKSGEATTVYHFGLDTVLIDAKTKATAEATVFAEGKEVIVIFNENTPVTMSMPPQMTPAVVVATDAASKVRVDKFDEKAVSSDGMFQYLIDDKTEIVDLKGEKVAKDALADKSIAVFYANSTKSIPEKATATKLLVLDDMKAFPKYEAQYVTVVADIAEITKTDNGYRAFVNYKDSDESMVLNIADTTLVVETASKDVIEASALEVGNRINFTYAANTPVAMSMPPQMTPAVVMLMNSESIVFAKVDKFDDNLISSDGLLKLNLAEGVKIVDPKGNELKPALVNGQVSVVFYKTSTFSIPAVTTPESVVVIPSKQPRTQVTVKAEIDAAIAELPANLVIEKAGVKYVAVAPVMRAIGFEVEWVGASQSVEMRIDNASYVLYIGKTDFAFNRAMGYLDNAVFAKDGRTFVDVAFFDHVAARFN